jgi:alpha-beta hydrolase superfamily lysophospholipase
MRILFLHGWHSAPGGVKPTYLKDHGHTVINPALDDDDFDAALATAQAEFDRQQPDVVVGSSRGGGVAVKIGSDGGADVRDVFEAGEFPVGLRRLFGSSC